MKIAITAFCFFLTLTLDGQLNDAEAFFNGNYNKTYIRTHNVKQVLVETYIKGSKSSLSNFSFTRSGFLIKETIFDKSGKKVNDFLFTYNKHGDLIERKNLSDDLNKVYVTSFTKMYKNLHLVQENSNDGLFVKKHVYNKKGEKVQSSYMMKSDTEKSVKQVFFYSYDTKGRLKCVEEANIKNKTSKPDHVGRTTFIYDKAGNITETIREGKANYYLKYDKKGLLLTKVTNMPSEFDTLGLVDKYSYTFWK